MKTFDLQCDWKNGECSSLGCVGSFGRRGQGGTTGKENLGWGKRESLGLPFRRPNKSGLFCSLCLSELSLHEEKQSPGDRNTAIRLLSCRDAFSGVELQRIIFGFLPPHLVSWGGHRWPGEEVRRVGKCYGWKGGRLQAVVRCSHQRGNEASSSVWHFYRGTVDKLQAVVLIKLHPDMSAQPWGSDLL